MTSPHLDSDSREEVVVKLDHISKTFAGPPPVRALQAISLKIRRGDLLTITGPSGAGKSTLLNLVGLLDNPTTGTYFLDGLDVSTLNDHDRTRVRGRKVGFVFQSFHLMDHRSCRENVFLPLLYQGFHRSSMLKMADDALARVGLANFADRHPTTLSGGERQRVAIARAIVASPAILLCDEPTGSLDSKTSESILTLFQDLNTSGATLIIVTHDADVAALGRRRLSVCDGWVEEQEDQPLLETEPVI